MDDDDRLRALMAGSAIKEARRTLSLARVRCLAFDALLDRLRKTLSDESSSEIVFAMIERSRDEDQDRALAIVLNELCANADTVPGERKAWLERQIGRLLETLPNELSGPIALAMLSHRRKSRQAIGLKCLSKSPIDDKTMTLMLSRFRDTQNIAFLKCLLRQPLQLAAVDPYDLIGAFEDSYWKMRVVEATLKSDSKVGERFAATHPVQFVWAVGRLNYTDAIPMISECMRRANDKAELVGIVAWAFGKLGAYEQLIELAPMLDQLDEENDAQLDAMFRSHQTDKGALPRA